MLLAAAGKEAISPLVAALPQRFTHSDRIQNFPTARSQAIIAAGIADPQQLIRNLGFADVTVAHVDTTDGLRLTLSDGTIVHLRPSGNAPELRCYVEADAVEIAMLFVIKTLNQIPYL
jgi:phosphomannomutase